MGHKKQKGDAATQSVTTETKLKGTKESTHEDHPQQNRDKPERSETSDFDFIYESTGDEEATESIGFFYAFTLSILNFIELWYEYVKGYHPCVESVLNIFECLEKRLEDFFRKHGGITHIKWDDLVEFLKSLYAEVKSYLMGDKDPLEISHKYWHKTHLAILKSLEDIERIHECLFPPIKGVEPLFKIDKSKKHQIWQICFYMNMNLFHRVWLTISKSVSDWMISCCSSKSKTISKRTAKSNEDAAPTKKKKPGRQSSVEILILQPVD